MNNQKNCLICLYLEVCEDRKKDETITDCCVPLDDLREKQTEAFKQGGISRFAEVTNEHVNKYKLQSKYWMRVKVE